MNLAGCGRVFWGRGGFRKAPTVNRELDYMLVGRGALAVSRGWLTGVRRDIFSACEIERFGARSHPRRRSYGEHLPAQMQAQDMHLHPMPPPPHL